MSDAGDCACASTLPMAPEPGVDLLDDSFFNNDPVVTAALASGTCKLIKKSQIRLPPGASVNLQIKMNLDQGLLTSL